MTKRTANVVVTVKSAEGRSSGGQVPGASEAARAMAARLRARIEARTQEDCGCGKGDACQEDTYGR